MLCFVKAFTTLNKVWTRVKGPILGLLLLLSVNPLISDNSEPINLNIIELLFSIYKNDLLVYIYVTVNRHFPLPILLGQLDYGLYSKRNKNRLYI